LHWFCVNNNKKKQTTVQSRLLGMCPAGHVPLISIACACRRKRLSVKSGD